MKNKMLLFLSIVVVLLFIVACAPKVSDEQLENDLSKLSPEEQDALLKQAESSNAAAGNAVATRYSASKPQLVRVLTKTLNQRLALPDLVILSAGPDPTNTMTNATGKYVRFWVTVANTGKATTGTGFDVNVKSLPEESLALQVSTLAATQALTPLGWHKCSGPGKVDTVNVFVNFNAQVKESNMNNNKESFTVSC